MNDLAYFIFGALVGGATIYFLGLYWFGSNDEDDGDDASF